MSEKKTESRQAMAMKATVQQKFGDACEYGENQINQWPRQYRFTRGTRMPELIDEIAVLLEMAQRKYRIKTSLHEADARLAALFRLLRRSNCAKYKVTRRVSGKPAKDENGAQITDMKRLVDDHTYGVWSGLLIETGKMLDAWIQKVEAVPYKNDGRECD